MHMNSVRFFLNIGLEKALLLFFGFGLKTKKDKNNSLVDALKSGKKQPPCLFVVRWMERMGKIAIVTMLNLTHTAV